MSRGDHVYVRRRRRYSHHGIDCGDGTVIHFVRVGADRRVERTSWEEFARGAKVRVRHHLDRRPVEEIMANAESRLGAGGYHLVRNNCEHLATWAATGSSVSKQVRGWAIAAPGAFASVGVSQLAGIHMMLLATLWMGGYALARPVRRLRLRRVRSQILPG